jgi:hypothetical protein
MFTRAPDAFLSPNNSNKIKFIDGTVLSDGSTKIRMLPKDAIPVEDYQFDMS